MSSDAWRKALAVVKSRFERLAERYFQLSHRVYEYREAERPKPPEIDLPTDDPDDPLIQTFGWARFNCFIPVTIESPSLSDTATHVRYQCNGLSRPGANRWRGWGWFYGHGFDEFSNIAGDAWKLVMTRPDLVPIPAHIMTALKISNPTASAFLPGWRRPPYDWANVVHWIGRDQSDLILKVQTWTWWDEGTGTLDRYQDALNRAAPSDTSLPKPDSDNLPPRFYSDIPDIVSASSRALDWLSDRAIQADDEDGSPQTPASIVPAQPPKDSPGEVCLSSLDLGGRALNAAILLKQIGKRVSLSAVCKAAGIGSRSHFRSHYPAEYNAIKELGRPDGKVRRGRRAPNGDLYSTDHDED